MSKVQSLLELLNDLSKPCQPGDKRKKCKKVVKWFGPYRGIGFPRGNFGQGHGSGDHDGGHADHGGQVGGHCAAPTAPGMGGSPGAPASGGAGSGSAGGSGGSGGAGGGH